MSTASIYADIRMAFREWLDTAPPGARKVAYRGDLDADRTETGKAVRAALNAAKQSKSNIIEFDPGVPGDPKRPPRHIVQKGAAG